MSLPAVSSIDSSSAVPVAPALAPVSPKPDRVSPTLSKPMSSLGLSNAPSSLSFAPAREDSLASFSRQPTSVEPKTPRDQIGRNHISKNILEADRHESQAYKIDGGKLVFVPDSPRNEENSNVSGEDEGDFKDGFETKSNAESKKVETHTVTTNVQTNHVERSNVAPLRAEPEAVTGSANASTTVESRTTSTTIETSISEEALKAANLKAQQKQKEAELEAAKKVAEAAEAKAQAEAEAAAAAKKAGYSYSLLTGIANFFKAIGTGVKNFVVAVGNVFVSAFKCVSGVLYSVFCAIRKQKQDYQEKLVTESTKFADLVNKAKTDKAQAAEAFRALPKEAQFAIETIIVSEEVELAKKSDTVTKVQENAIRKAIEESLAGKADQFPKSLVAAAATVYVKSFEPKKEATNTEEPKAEQAAAAGA